MKTRSLLSLHYRTISILILLAGFAQFAVSQTARQPDPIAASPAVTNARKITTIALYFDPQGGLSADAAVAYALNNNAELAAMKKEAEAGAALVRQARLRANPSLEISGTRQIAGMDNSLMVQGALPLELGGRVAARVRVAERELEIREQAFAERQRQVAADVRIKFGESIAAVWKLRFTEEILDVASQNWQLVSARVTEGRRPPLEQSMEAVELNRIRAMRETSESDVELRLLELRNLIGMAPDQPVLLRGDFENLLKTLQPQPEASERAIQTRPDLLGARAVERLAASRRDQVKAEGRIDADVMLGYQRMRSGFPLLGIQDTTGALLPIDSKFQFFTFGLTLKLPVRNRNQGLIAAALLEEDAARSRREFGELTIRREVAAAYARYNRALRAEQIYRVGVRDQAAANLNVVRQTYEEGSKTLLDYIADQRRFIETEREYIDSQFEAYASYVDILRTTNAPELTNK